MNEEHFFTFAYGSNMLCARIRDRCSSVEPIGVAELKGFKLRWHKRSKKDGSGKCDIVSASTSKTRVFGVLYRVAMRQKCLLDKAEGLEQGYAEIEIEVLCKGERIAATAYQATDIDHSLKPYSWYHALVVAGAKEHCLPAEYISRLETVATQEDLNRARHNKNMRLIGEMQE